MLKKEMTRKGIKGEGKDIKLSDDQKKQLSDQFKQQLKQNGDGKDAGYYCFGFYGFILQLLGFGFL